MLSIATKVHVAADGRLESLTPTGLPPGDHEAIIVIAERPQRRKRFRIEDFPKHDLPWDDSISLRREDMYGDDGR
jgi:hypothetical protein